MYLPAIWPATEVLGDIRVEKAGKPLFNHLSQSPKSCLKSSLHDCFVHRPSTINHRPLPGPFFLVWVASGLGWLREAFMALMGRLRTAMVMADLPMDMAAMALMATAGNQTR